MAQFNEESRELAIKVVYYGPALSGKTTNLQSLYQKMDPRVRGRLMTLDTKDDRTLFFDMMPVFFRTPGGVKVKIKLYTVPGQVMHESTRRIVLQGSDAVVFVADARRSEAATTLAYSERNPRGLEWNVPYAHIAPRMPRLSLSAARADSKSAITCAAAPTRTNVPASSTRRSRSSWPSVARITSKRRSTWIAVMLARTRRAVATRPANRRKNTQGSSSCTPSP